MERLLEPYLRSLASTKFTSLLLQRDRVCSAKALSREGHQWLRAPGAHQFGRAKPECESGQGGAGRASDSASPLSALAGDRGSTKSLRVTSDVTLKLES